jgi:hypothetical protein
MTISQTPSSVAERRLAIARRLYEALVGQDPNRAITLCDVGGGVVAQHDPRPERLRYVNATLREGRVIDLELIGRPGRPPIPRPRRPDHKSLQAEATTCRSPGSVDCPGFFFGAVNLPADILRTCCYQVTGRELFETQQIIRRV